MAGVKRLPKSMALSSWRKKKSSGGRVALRKKDKARDKKFFELPREVRDMVYKEVMGTVPAAEEPEIWRHSSAYTGEIKTAEVLMVHGGGRAHCWMVQPPLVPTLTITSEQARQEMAESYITENKDNIIFLSESVAMAEWVKDTLTYSATESIKRLGFIGMVHGGAIGPLFEVINAFHQVGNKTAIDMMLMYRKLGESQPHEVPKAIIGNLVEEVVSLDRASDAELRRSGRAWGFRLIRELNETECVGCPLCE